jgi:hypothetical protein
MSWSSLVLIVALLLSVTYLVLAIKAFGHVRPEEKGRRSYPLLLMDPWWPFYDNLYMESAQRTCPYGKILLPLIVAAWLLWGAAQLR